MSIVRIALAGCIVFLSGCVGTQQPAPTYSYAPYPLTDDQIAAIQQQLATQLKDPGSAQFGPIQAAISTQDKSVAVCGTVNAKNSYGGYTGTKPYVGALDGGSFRLLVLGGPERDTAVAQSVCAKAGMPV